MKKEPGRDVPEWTAARLFARLILTKISLMCKKNEKASMFVGVFG